MGDQSFSHLTTVNRELLTHREHHLRDLLEASAIIHFLRPCRVRVLLVVDGLDYSLNNFGLRTFVETLLATSGRVRFQISLAHIFSDSGAAMMDPDARISERITNFKFDNPAHFTADKYDVVFLFGIATSFFGRGPGYPGDSLSNAELQILAAFQNGGGGLFATGDHGALGKPLCSKVARARNMRLWDSTSADPSLDEVSMGGPRRNDTNRIGDPGSQFDDQSDDIPQAIKPKIYSVSNGIFRYSFPHPLLCGPNGVIRVLPDHPHEGECIAPPNPDLPLNYTGPLGQEYPAASGGGARPLPEIIATLDVLPGTTSSGKDSTVGHSFGGICAYDGHRAGVGRVVTDSTWHHFVNVNLIGHTSYPPGDRRRLGFLWSATGQAHLEEIKTYFRNIATWLSRPANLSCMRSRLLWDVVYSDRVLEAVLTTRGVRLAQLHPKTLWLIGRHAKDVIGRFAGQCQSRRLIIDIFPIELMEVFPDIDPWDRGPRPPMEDDGVPWMDGNPLMEIALGGALVAINEEFGLPNPEIAEKVGDREIEEAARKGAAAALEVGIRSMSATLGAVTKLSAARGSRPQKITKAARPANKRKPRKPPSR